MKKWFLVLLALLVLQKWGDITRWLNPPPDYGAMHGGKVVLYATDWCTYCAQTRELMRAHGITFHEYDIEKDPVGREQFERLGGVFVPLLVVRGEIIRGYDPEKLLELAGNP